MKSNYLSLWLLLAAALVIVCAIAADDGNVSILGYTPRKAPMTDVMHPRREPVNFLEPTLPVLLHDSVPEQEEIPVDSTSQSILIFGDSMTLNLAYRLAAYAKHNGHQIHSVNWDSSNTKIWAESDTLQYFIDKYHPTFFFICLGSNEMYYKNASSRAPYIQRIVSKLHGKPFIWIGPPTPSGNSHVSGVIAENVGISRFFDSDNISLERKADKIHPSRRAAEQWMDSIMRWMPHSAHPFIAETPPDSLRRANPHVTFLKPH